MQVNATATVVGDSVTQVAADSMQGEPAHQTPDYDQLGKDLDKKSPLEIMDHVSDQTQHQIQAACAM